MVAFLKRPSTSTASSGVKTRLRLGISETDAGEKQLVEMDAKLTDRSVNMEFLGKKKTRFLDGSFGTPSFDSR